MLSFETRSKVDALVESVAENKALLELLRGSDSAREGASRATDEQSDSGPWSPLKNPVDVRNMLPDAGILARDRSRPGRMVELQEVGRMARRPQEPCELPPSRNWASPLLSGL